MVFEAPLAGLMEVPFEVSFVGWFEDPEFDPFEDLPVVPYDDQEKTVEIPTKKESDLTRILHVISADCVSDHQVHMRLINFAVSPNKDERKRKPAIPPS